MARSTIRLTVQRSPDLVELMDYAVEAIERLAPLRHADSRVAEILAEFFDATHPQGKSDLVDIDRNRGGQLCISPGDAMLRLMAKLRAVDRAVS